MFKKANITWMTKQIAKMMGKGTIRTDNAIQRRSCWTKDRKSLLIHSILVGFPIGPVYAVKDENGYDLLDGKQRLTTITEFRNDEFALTDIPDIEFDMDYGKDLMNLTGMKFSDLPDEVKDIFDGYSVNIYYFDELTDEDINEMFFRLNGGVPLSAIEMTRVRTKSFDIVREISQHELFTSTLTKSAMEKYANEDIVMKSYVLLQNTETDLSTKTVRKIMEENEITEDDKERLVQIYGMMLKMYADIKDKKIRKKMVTRIHLLSLVPIINEVIKSGMVDDETVEKFVTKFFSTENGEASISERYNKYVGSGSARKEAVAARYEEMMNVLKEVTEGKDNE